MTSSLYLRMEVGGRQRLYLYLSASLEVFSPPTVFRFVLNTY